MKSVEQWHSARIEQSLRLARWGEFGTPVLIFPTAGGDAEEIERMGLIDALGGLLAAGRIKVYSVDSIAGRSWLEQHDPRHSMWLQNAFDSAIYHEVVPAIRTDCASDSIEVVVSGASIGAFNAVASLCRHPDAFRVAICMSGTFDLTGWLHGNWSDDFYFSSPIHWLPNHPEDERLARLRSRFVVLASGQGSWEDPSESWKMSSILGSRGVPNRVDLWSHSHDHDWPTWQEMLPLYLDDLA
jgi:esterase/lipase superfamily enzyme